MGGKRGGPNNDGTAMGGAAYASGYPQESSPPFPQGDRNPYADENDGWKEGDPAPPEIAALLPADFTAEDVRRELEKHRERERKALLGGSRCKCGAAATAATTAATGSGGYVAGPQRRN